MQEKSLQGTLPIGASVIYTCPAGKIGKIANMRFFNSAAYGIILSRLDALTGTWVVIYDFTLDPADTVVDNNIYMFKENDSISVNATVANTDYLLYIVEY